MFCQPYSNLSFLVFSSDAPALLYYSHLPAALIALLLSGFIFSHNRKLIEARILGLIAVLFSAWSVIDLFVWTQTDARIVTYLWSFWYIFFCLLFALSAYFLYSFTKHEDLSFKKKLLLFLPLLPLVALSALGLNFKGFDITGCNALSTPLVLIYTYGLSSIYFVVMTVFAVRQYIRAGENRKKVLLVSLGILLFLISFSIASYISDISSLFQTSADVFNIEQYGYFGMTIFIGFLTYVIVQYKAFSVKLVAAQALVASLVVLIGSQFFFIHTNVNRILNGITFILAVGFGYLLVKSVKREIAAKEALAIANAHLEELNRQKSEFVSFASHQLRSPLTSIKGNASMILEGDFGQLNPQLHDVVNTIMQSVNTQINVVEDYLNVSRIELGTMKYNLDDMDFKDLLRQIVDEQKPNIEAKGLSYSLSIDDSQTYRIKADPDKFKQVIMNLIDNSVKYTPTGSLAISLSKANGMVRFEVADTGVGINPAVMPKLFQKFSRADNAHEANIHGTGLGLFLAKDIVKAHGGRVWAESEGEGKGSQFYVEVPEVR